jgi:hypothetical protein
MIALPTTRPSVTRACRTTLVSVRHRLSRTNRRFRPMVRCERRLRLGHDHRPGGRRRDQHPCVPRHLHRCDDTPAAAADVAVSAQRRPAQGSSEEPEGLVALGPQPVDRHALCAQLRCRRCPHRLQRRRARASLAPSLRFGSTSRFGSAAADSQTPVARLRRRARRRRAVRGGWRRRRRPE